MRALQTSTNFELPALVGRRRLTIQKPHAMHLTNYRLADYFLVLREVLIDTRTVYYNSFVIL